jgi:hypothetical protein
VTIWSSFELVTLVASALALRAWLPAKIVAWIGFAGNFLLSLLAGLFVLTFEFQCCGYLCEGSGDERDEYRRRGGQRSV